jgi:hypothetical protein
LSDAAPERSIDLASACLASRCEPLHTVAERRFTDAIPSCGYAAGVAERREPMYTTYLVVPAIIAVLIGLLLPA